MVIIAGDYLRLRGLRGQFNYYPNKFDSNTFSTNGSLSCHRLLHIGRNRVTITIIHGRNPSKNDEAGFLLSFNSLHQFILRPSFVRDTTVTRTKTKGRLEMEKTQQPEGINILVYPWK